MVFYLKARVVFDAFYNAPALSQEDLQEFQFHLLDLIPAQLQRFDFADSFGTLDEMFSVMERQTDLQYPTVLQISYFMWPIVNGSNAVTSIAPPSSWQKRELSQIGKMFFLLPKSVLSQIKPDIINSDSNVLGTIRSNHLSQFQIWKLTAQILQTVDDRFKPDYIFMLPAPFQKGIPTQNISQALLGTVTVRAEILRALLEETSGMLTSQKAVILQRISHRLGESIIIRTMISTSDPSEMFQFMSPKAISKNMATIIKTIMEMPETGRFGLTSIQTKLLPQGLLSLWLKWVRENSQVSRWTSEDLLGRSSVGGQNELNLAILGLSCRDIEIVDPWDILSVFMHYRHELYVLRKFKPSLTFNVNLRSCVLQKFIEYLKQKRFLSGEEASSNLLAGITGGEIEAIGGEILSLIPTQVLEKLSIETREIIIKEIGKLEMQELFSLVPLENLHWYAKALFRDTEISTASGVLRKRRQDAIANPTDALGDSTNSTGEEIVILEGRARTFPPTPIFMNSTIPSSDIAERNARGPEEEAGSLPQPAAQPTPSSREIDLQSLNSMGNLLCYADNIFDDTRWPRSLMKDVLETKTLSAEKTCCLTKNLRDKWFETLQAVYGSDTSSWNEFDLAAIGDLLIVLPDADLHKISTDALGKAATPMMRQSAYSTKIRILGQPNPIQFVTACADALGTEGMEFIAQYKKLMKRVFQASQWMVNTVKTTQELIREGIGRTGRIPRWAEHTLVKRQISLSMGGNGQLAYSSAPSSDTPAVAAYPATSSYIAQPTGAAPAQYLYSQPAVTGDAVYAPSPVVPTYPAPSQAYTPQYAAVPVYAPQPAPSFAPQPVVSFAPQPDVSFAQQPVASFAPQSVGSFAPQPVASFAPQSVGSFAPQPVASFVPQPVGSFAQQPEASFAPQPVASFAPQSVGSFAPQSVTSFDPRSVGTIAPQPDASFTPQTAGATAPQSDPSFASQPVGASPQQPVGASASQQSPVDTQRLTKSLQAPPQQQPPLGAQQPQPGSSAQVPPQQQPPVGAQQQSPSGPGAQMPPQQAPPGVPQSGPGAQTAPQQQPPGGVQQQSPGPGAQMPPQQPPPGVPQKPQSGPGVQLPSQQSPIGMQQQQFQSNPDVQLPPQQQPPISSQSQLGAQQQPQPSFNTLPSGRLGSPDLPDPNQSGVSLQRSLPFGALQDDTHNSEVRFFLFSF